MESLTNISADLKYQHMSNTNFKCVANLGDVDPVEHGGIFVMESVDGSQEPQIWHLWREDGAESWSLFIFDIPAVDQPGAEWWWADLHRACAYGDVDRRELLADLRGSDVTVRAHAYVSLAQYHGWQNFDHEPLTYDRAQAEAMVAEIVR